MKINVSLLVAERPKESPYLSPRTFVNYRSNLLQLNFVLIIANYECENGQKWLIEPHLSWKLATSLQFFSGAFQKQFLIAVCIEGYEKKNGYLGLQRCKCLSIRM